MPDTRTDGITAVVVGLLAVHLAHDIRPDVAAQALLDSITPDPEGEADTEARQIVATALAVAGQMRP